MKASDIKRDENETTKNILGIYRRLEEVGPLPFWRFVCNPESFSQTVENIFYCAFLARDGKISIHETEDCQLPDAVIGNYTFFCQIFLCVNISPDTVDIAEAIEPASDEERARMQKFQYMVSLDMRAWRGLIKKYAISETVIPTRAAAQVRLNAAGGSKWYG